MNLWKIVRNIFRQTPAVESCPHLPKVERFLLNEMDAEEMEQFERHYFDCTQCFEAMRSGLEFVQVLKDGAGEPD